MPASSDGKSKLSFVGSAKEDLIAMPTDVVKQLGRALNRVQQGETPHNAKPFVGHKIFRGTSVMELVENEDGNTYRAVYTAKFGDHVFVLHCFQKKSKSGRATTQQDIELIKKRFAEAKAEWEDLEKTKTK